MTPKARSAHQRNDQWSVILLPIVLLVVSVSIIAVIIIQSF